MIKVACFRERLNQVKGYDCPWFEIQRQTSYIVSSQVQNVTLLNIVPITRVHISTNRPSLLDSYGNPSYLFSSSTTGGAGAKQQSHQLRYRNVDNISNITHFWLCLDNSPAVRSHKHSTRSNVTEIIIGNDS